MDAARARRPGLAVLLVARLDLRYGHAFAHRGGRGGMAADVNVAIGLGPAADHTKALHRSREALATVGLVDRAGEWPSTLSGGQKQRVALARALVSAPRVLALDEPLGALDALKRIEMQRLVEQVWLSNSFTAILVTHDVTEAVALGDRIVLIDHGAIAADIPVDLARPRRRGSPEFAGVEATILEHLLASGD
jgi:sulfonate transport system ATP-binding protein